MSSATEALRIKESPRRISKQMVKPVKKEIVYPERDGKPMSDNTKQFNWIVKIKEGLEILFADKPDVFIAGDLLWYPVEGSNKIRIAPDAMVVFGRPKGDRGLYRQWVEDGIAPQVVFEVLSPGNTPKEMDRKLEFYNHYGVEEYYEYDPDHIRLRGWIRREEMLDPIPIMQRWSSPFLKIRFEMIDNDLVIFRPDGQKFLSPVEMELIAKQEKMRSVQAETIAKQAEIRAEQAEATAEQERRRAEILEAKLKALEQREFQRKG